MNISNIVSRLNAYFPSRAEFKAMASGGGYETVAGLDSVPCRKYPAGDDVPATFDGQGTPYWILLQGHYPNVRTGMRVVISGQRLKVDSVEHDGGENLTKCFAVERTARPTGED